jgi:hypothetical protein
MRVSSPFDQRLGSGRRSRPIGAAKSGCLILVAAIFFGPAARASTTTLSKDNFTLSLYSTDNKGTSYTQLDTTTIEYAFTAHRCRCPTKVKARLQIDSDGQDILGTSKVEAEFMLGSDCDDSSSSCTSVGKVTLSASDSDEVLSFSSAAIYEVESGHSNVDCDALSSGAATLWAVLREGGVRLSSHPSLRVPVNVDSLSAPTGVTAQSADEGILIEWTVPDDTTQVAGYQVLCLPARTSTISAAYETCGENASSTATGLLGTFDATQVCSSLISATSTSVRLSGLQNGTVYTVAVVAIDQTGGTSALSNTASATPAPTVGFYETYRDSGGQAVGGCAVGGHTRAGFWSGLMVALMIGLCRRRRRCVRMIGLLLLAWPVAAQAQIVTEIEPWPDSDEVTSALRASPSRWTLGLGFGPYRPAIDEELAGQQPFADTFGSSRRLMSTLELDRHLSHRYGTWALGGRAGYYHSSAAAWAADGKTRSGDETTLTLVPLSVSLIYRADLPQLVEWSPLIPYAKVGLDYARWSTGRSNGASQSGWTPGWHASVGLLLDLSCLDARSLRSLKQESGIGGLALFIEWNNGAVDGLGKRGRLHVGDKTWLAGLAVDF